MFSRTILRNLALRKAVLRSLPRPPLFRTPQQPSPLLKRFESNQPWPRYPPPPPPRGKPPRKIHTRWDPEQIRSARPLVRVEQLSNVVRHPYSKGMVIIVVVGGVVFYFSNIEEVPVSGRRRFNCYSDEAVEEDGKTYYKMIMDDARQQGALVPSWDRRAKMVSRVMERLIPQSGLDGADWEVNVLESPEANAFVVPGGKVFVYTGILPIAKTDDGLAAILGHEIAHNVARHSAEAMSQNLIFVAPLRILMTFLDYAGYTAGLGRMIGEAVMGLGVVRPASRKQESEADYIGLMIMAKACYNPEAAVEVWQRMEKATKEQIPEWLSTHPSNTNRIANMTSWLPKALDARAESSCGATIGYQSGFAKALPDFGFRF